MNVRAPRGQRRLIALVCHRCGRDYFVPPYRAQGSRFCSKACTALNKRCERCNKPITKRPGRRRFCSHACASAAMSGPNSPVWKGGYSKRRRGKHAVKLRRWSREVLKRDRFRCTVCGNNRELQAHHVKPYADYPRLRFDVANGKTLCAICHRAEHGHKPMANGFKCYDCGKPCTPKFRQGKPRCRSCGVKLWHALGRPSKAEHTEAFRQLSLRF